MAAVLERDLVPPGPFRLPRSTPDGLMRRRGHVLHRLLHHGGHPALVSARITGGAVRLRAESRTREAACHALDRMGFALGVGLDLRPFHEAFKRDPLLGPIIRRGRWHRPLLKADPWEALYAAVTEQLIDGERAHAIQRRITWRYGRPSACGRLRDAPAAGDVAGRAPAELAACDLAPKRAIALIRVAREVASGRADLGEHETAWRRLRAIPNIGSWTVEKLAFEGQGRLDQLPAGDLAYLKLVGRLAGLGRRATEPEVREFFAPYAPYEGIAGVYLVRNRLALATATPPAT